MSQLQAPAGLAEHNITARARNGLRAEIMDIAGPPPVAGCNLPSPQAVFFFQNLSSCAGPLDPVQLPPEWSDA